MTYRNPYSLSDSEREPFDEVHEYLTAKTLWQALQAPGVHDDAEIHIIIDGKPVNASRVYVQRIPGTTTVVAITNEKPESGE